MYLYCLRYPDELKHQISTCCARRKKLEKQKKLVHALAENVLLPCYSAWQSFLRVIEVLLSWFTSCPSHIWNPGFRLISCFQRYRASPNNRTRDPGIKKTGIFIMGSSGCSLPQSETSPTCVKCITQEDSKETMAIPSSKRMRSTCAQIPFKCKHLIIEGTSR